MTKPKTRNRLALLKDNEINCIECQEICLHKIKYDIAGEEPIECVSCQKWHHRKCLDKPVTKKDWESLTGENESITFNCSTCIQGRGEKVNELKEIKQMMLENQVIMQSIQKTIKEQVHKAVESKFTDVNSKHDALEKKVTDNETKNEERFQAIERELKKQGNQDNEQKDENEKKLYSMISNTRENVASMENKIKDEVKMYLDSQQDKEKRKNNLIIHRLEETQVKKEDQIARDKADVLKIIATTNPELIAELQNTLLEEKRITRLGNKKPDATRPRPLRIILPEEDIKIDILKGCSNLKDSPFSHISVQQDLTIAEQKKHYQLRKECRERKDKGEKVRLYRGKIIVEQDSPDDDKEDEEEGEEGEKNEGEEEK